MNLAARTTASPDFLPHEDPPLLPSQEKEALVEADVEDPKSHAVSAGPNQLVSSGQNKKRKSTGDDVDAPPGNRSKVSEDANSVKSLAVTLQTADIEWEAASEADSDSSEEQTKSSSPPPDSIVQSEYNVSVGEEVIRQATLHFVKAILNPFYHAQVIRLVLLPSCDGWIYLAQCSPIVLQALFFMQVVDRDVYKEVLQRVVDKIVQTHNGAEDASFLVEEASRIRRLVEDYIRHMQDQMTL